MLVPLSKATRFNLHQKNVWLIVFVFLCFPSLILRQQNRNTLLNHSIRFYITGALWQCVANNLSRRTREKEKRIKTLVRKLPRTCSTLRSREVRSTIRKVSLQNCYMKGWTGFNWLRRRPISEVLEFKEREILDYALSTSFCEIHLLTLHLPLVLPSDLLPSAFPIKTLHAYLGALAYIVRSAYYFHHVCCLLPSSRLLVRPAARINKAPAERNFVKFYTRDFYENVSRNFKFD